MVSHAKKDAPFTGLDARELYALLDALPIGAGLFDESGLVLHINAELERLTGFDRREARGLPCAHVLRTGRCGRACPHRASGAGLAGMAPMQAVSVQPVPVDDDVVNRARRRIPVRITPVRIQTRTGPLTVDLVEDRSGRGEGDVVNAGVGEIIGKCAAMTEVLARMRSCAGRDEPVFLRGETGVGKDLFARTLHALSPRGRRPFIRLNLGFPPENLLEVELFGRAADEAAGLDALSGQFEKAQGGTIHLAEIADSGPEIQARLVEYLKTGAVRPVGGEAPVKLDVRLVVSSRLSLEELVREGRLSSEAALLIGGLTIDLPPLRERGEDVEFLLAHFAAHFAERFKKPVKGFSPDALALLADYDYPGNIRELKNIVEYAVMTAKTPLILPANLPVHLGARSESKSGVGAKGEAASPVQSRKGRKKA